MRRNIILCLDGTWNNTSIEKVGKQGKPVLKPTNVLKMARAALPVISGKHSQIIFYQVGVGASVKYDGLPNKLLYRADSFLGGAFGAGFQAKVEDAANFLFNNYQQGDGIFITGFSRGAAVARALVRFLDWMGFILDKRDVYYLPYFLREFFRAKGRGNGKAYLDQLIQQNIDVDKDEIDESDSIDLVEPEASQNTTFEITTTDNKVVSVSNQLRVSDPRPHFSPVLSFKVDLLAVYDTVLSLRSRLFSRDPFPFLNQQDVPKCVVRALHAIAIDESRADFLPTIWTRSPSGTSLEQRWFSGVHSNIGGSYAHDGLANCALQWFASEMTSAEVALDHKFLQNYGAWAGDLMYQSDSKMWSFLDSLRGINGERNLIQADKAAASHCKPVLSYTVFERMLLVPSPDKTLTEPYRPQNLIEYIRYKKFDVDQIIALYHAQHAGIKDETKKREALTMLLDEIMT